jgi:nitronate monooxygenase
MTAIPNRLTGALNFGHPVISAQMHLAAGGVLAAADEQFEVVAAQRAGIGFITWPLRKSPSLLTHVPKRHAAAAMLSFGDPRPLVDEIRKASALVICQCQNTDHVWDAIDIGADRRAVATNEIVGTAKLFLDGPRTKALEWQSKASAGLLRTCGSNARRKK